MEERKQKEIEYYDRHAEKLLGRDLKSDFEGFNPYFLASYKFCHQWLRENCQDKNVLDYGCGNGLHSLQMARMGAKVVSIDLSEKSLEFSKKMAQREGLSARINFLKMDCEKMEFPDNFFDIVFDGGTFSSLDLKLAFPELIRILKEEGILIGIETLGHNPIANLKRKINRIFKKRTEWAVSHIFQLRDLEVAKKYFKRSEAYFFHIVSFLAFPFLNLPGGKILLSILESLDKVLFSPPFLRKYAFKVVFILSLPKKS